MDLSHPSMFDDIVGASRALQTVLSRISKVAPSDSTILVTGETGTGKELVARSIHRRSDRVSRAFVSVNCAAIPVTSSPRSCSALKAVPSRRDSALRQETTETLARHA
jgi:transcriptional regulator with PAS, ATPase and Fis domain